MAVYELANANNWESVWHESFVGQPLGTSSYLAIPEINVPILLDRNLVAVFATSTKNPGYWNLAGWAKQKLQLGITGTPSPDSVAQSARKFFLERFTLLEFSNYANSYGVAFNIPYWIDQISLYLFKYIGPVFPEQQTGLMPGSPPSQLLGSGIGGGGSSNLPGLGFP